MSVPIHTFGLNNMMVKNYTRKDIGRITKPEPAAAPPLLKYMAFDITPERGDMAAIRKYFAEQEAVERWGYKPPALPKRKTTDELMRDFFMKSIQQEDHRRAMKEAEEGMPFYGVMASQEQKQRMATQALADKAVSREGAKRRIVSWMGSPQMISRVKAIAEPPVAVTDLMDEEFQTPARGGSLRKVRSSATRFVGSDSDEEAAASIAAPPKRSGRPLGSKNKTADEIMAAAVAEATRRQERPTRK